MGCEHLDYDFAIKAPAALEPIEAIIKFMRETSSELSEFGKEVGIPKLSRTVEDWGGYADSYFEPAVKDLLALAEEVIAKYRAIESAGE